MVRIKALEAVVQRCSTKKISQIKKKHLLQSPFSKKLHAASCNFLKKGTSALVFPCKFCKFYEHLFCETSPDNWF